ncbi:hypothetical protein EDB84DRAFT_1676787 [Lactarius hengduanensis]|nr:hypothetical protein EDB84DRAFT_1676787 [Lactarius hengduanensis]
MLIAASTSICSIIGHSPLQPTTSACFENGCPFPHREKPRGVLGLSKNSTRAPQVSITHFTSFLNINVVCTLNGRAQPTSRLTRLTPLRVKLVHRNVKHQQSLRLKAGWPPKALLCCGRKYLKSMEEQDNRRRRGTRERRTALSCLYVPVPQPSTYFPSKHMFKDWYFSAVVTVSLVESYKWLSPDPANETVSYSPKFLNNLSHIQRDTPREHLSWE